MLSGGCTISSSVKKSARTRAITGLDTWLEAWSLYAGVLVSFQPELAPDLFRYQNFITRQSRRFKVYAWLQYDAQLRLKLASNPSVKLSDVDTELVATWLSADATREKPACFTCGNPEHMDADCPCKASGTDSIPVLSCPVCSVAGHTVRKCPKLSQPVPPLAEAHSAGDEFCHIYSRCGNCFVAHAVSIGMPVPITPSEFALGSPADIFPIHLHTIHTPLLSHIFAQFLHKHPDKAFISKLIQSLKYGFNIGYLGPYTLHISSNLQSALKHCNVIDEAFQKEVANNRMAGPYKTPPYHNLRCSGVGVVPKKDGSWRLINHLSAPRGNSINDYIDPSRYSLQYTAIDDAIAVCFKLGKGALMAKGDLRNAFRLCPVRPED